MLAAQPVTARKTGIDPAAKSLRMSDMCGRLSLAAGQARHLRKGDLVEVRTPAEILATLDASGALDGVPFMPEMLSYLGGRFTVAARVERACDTISSSGARRMPDTVLLDDLRCDGAGHDGCQAGCRLYWKEAWLRRISADAPRGAHPSDEGQFALEQLARKNTTAMRLEDGEEVETYRCQATEFLQATEEIGWWNARSFMGEVACRNVGPVRFLRVTLRAVAEEILRRLGLFSDRPFKDPRGAVTTAQLDLKPGDLVEVRSKDEIAETLDAGGKTRGLWFDREMLPYCGERHTVKQRVERLIDERSGRMIELTSDCYILDGVVCRGYVSYGRWFCPRAIYPYWRECWLQRPEQK
jgi:hypothetical protein